MPTHLTGKQLRQQLFMQQQEGDQKQQALDQVAQYHEGELRNQGSAGMMNMLKQLYDLDQTQQEAPGKEALQTAQTGEANSRAKQYDAQTQLLGTKDASEGPREMAHNIQTGVYPPDAALYNNPADYHAHLVAQHQAQETGKWMDWKHQAETGQLQDPKTGVILPDKERDLLMHQDPQSVVYFKSLMPTTAALNPPPPPIAPLSPDLGIPATAKRLSATLNLTPFRPF